VPNIRHELLIEASAEDIFKAITTQEGLSGWWTPGVTAKPERGAIARLPFGAKYHKEMRIEELTPPKLVRWTCLAGEDEWIDTRLSFEIEGGGAEALNRSHYEIAGQVAQVKDPAKATLVVFRHQGWREESPMFGECNYTWGQFLRSLKLYCETGKGNPFPNQHRAQS
jgi:uncharacterized protein YndB with AHSA1/START domain